MTSPASVEGGERLRLFCALRLPDDVLDVIVEWQGRTPLLPDVRVVPREHLHLTLAFLGSRPAAELDVIVGALREAAARAAPAELVLPRRRLRLTRSVGMLVLRDVTGAATALAADLHARLGGLGVYEPEKRKWLPHVTVVRFRRPPRLEAETPELPTFSPSDAAVYSSVLRPSGARYEVLESVPLGG